MSESLKSRLAEADSVANSEFSGGAGGAGGVEYAAMSWETAHVKVVVVKQVKSRIALFLYISTFILLGRLFW